MFTGTHITELQTTARIAYARDARLYLLPYELFKALHSIDMIGMVVHIGRVEGYGVALPEGSYKVKSFETLVNIPSILVMLSGNVRSEIRPHVRQELVKNAEVIVLEVLTEEDADKIDC